MWLAVFWTIVSIGSWTISILYDILLILVDICYTVYDVPLGYKLCIAVCLLFYWYSTWTFGLFRVQRIPGPIPWPILGNLWHILTKGQREYDGELLRCYGNVVGTYEGRTPVLLVADREMLRHIMVTHFSHFHTRRTAGLSEYPFHSALPQLQGAHWKHVRSVITPAFSTAKLKQIGRHISSCAEMFVSNLKQQTVNTADTVNVRQHCGAFSMDVIARSAFGLELNSQANQQSPFVTYANKFFRTLSIMNPVAIVILLFPFTVNILKYLHIKIMPTDAIHFFINIIDQTITSRKASLQKTFDFLQILIDAERTEEDADQTHTNLNKTPVLNGGSSKGSSVVLRKKKNSFRKAGSQKGDQYSLMSYTNQSERRQSIFSFLVNPCKSLLSADEEEPLWSLSSTNGISLDSLTSNNTYNNTFEQYPCTVGSDPMTSVAGAADCICNQAKLVDLDDNQFEPVYQGDNVDESKSKEANIYLPVRNQSETSNNQPEATNNKSGSTNKQLGPVQKPIEPISKPSEPAKNQTGSTPFQQKRIGLTLEEIHAQALIFFVAGYETTASSLSYIMYCLATNPRCQEKLREEIDGRFPNDEDEVACDRPALGYEECTQLPYLDMCIQEALRLYPPAPRTTRVCSHDTEVGNVVIQRGMLVAIPIFHLHRDPNVWTDPDAFIPERFHDNGGKVYESCYSYMPFGAGPRKCVGSRLAMLELKIATVHLMRHFILHPHHDTQVPMNFKKTGLLQPEKEIRLCLEARRR